MATSRRSRSSGEKDYLSIAKKRVHTPDQIDSFTKALIYSRNKKGKTKFCLTAGRERTLHIDPEQGTDKFKKQRPIVWPLDKWEDMQDCWGALRTYELSPAALGQGSEEKPFDTVCLDGCTKINNMALRYIMRVEEERNLDRRPGIIDRRDYNKSGELMKDMINNFLKLRMNVIFTAQERMFTGFSGDEDEDEADGSVFFVPDLPAGVRGALNSVVDVIGRLYVVRVEVKGELRPQRRLQIGPHERYDTGARSDHKLPDVLKNPTFPKLVNLLETGKAA